jgi:hypothetical protein
MIKPLVNRMEQELENKDFVKAFATLVELRNHTSELKQWLMVKIGDDRI